uniref:Uncharacterized protein n=1 Tax=viral metagenome TaxID=1070528 RepID=A0A6C0HRR0_9ZZZZ
MSYVQNLYGNVPQQVDNALIPSKQNIFTGNLIQPLSGGKTRGGNFAAAIPPLSILAMRYLYGKKSRNRSSRRRKRFKRSRKLR